MSRALAFLDRWRAASALVLAAAAIVLTCMLHLGCASPVTPDTADKAPSRATSVAVYALSRGKGVPDATRAAFGKVRDLLEPLRREGHVTRLEETRIGLEGETRLCAEFKDTGAARDAIERIRKIASGVELLNVVEEPCDKEEHP